jgi:1-deoxy-D-xylulose-5-phosphate reductoisomerase
MKSKKHISILGSTGSIGRNALDVIERSAGGFSVGALAAGKNIRLLADQINRFRPELAAVMIDELAEELKGMIDASCTEVLSGKEGYKAVASMEGVDMVLSAMVGVAGLIPTISAINAGKDVALANKETLVSAGPIVKSLVKKKGINLIPVDSEHSALFQCLSGQNMAHVRRLILTASGGPFRQMDAMDLKKITAEEAVRHPNWSMGAKISVDSSTMMNKGLEVIEASFLFDLDIDKIDVIIHPESIIHSMVEFVDGSVLAQMSVPDMRLPIAYAFSWPERMELDLPPLDLSKQSSLTFEPPDLLKFPCLDLAYRAGRMGGSALTALNAANEVAVEAFLLHKISYLRISEVTREVLEGWDSEELTDLDHVIRADALARLKADAIIKTLEQRSKI